MFVHAGPSLHGPESGSESHQPHHHRHPHHNPAHRPIPLLRSALRPLSEITDPHHQRRDVSPATRRSFTEPAFPTSAPHVPSRRRPASEIVSKKDLSVRFQEPGMSHPSPSPSVSVLPSDDEESVAGSEFTASTTLTRASSSGGTKRRRTSRRSSRYAMAHPAPQLLTKQRTLVQIRPRLLLQLQKLGERRPTPAFDVVPSSIIAGSLLIPKLATRLPRLFGRKPQLGPDDLLILRSEDYNDHLDDTTPGCATFDNRELLAVISPLPELGDDGSEIIMEDGTLWSTDRIANGSYEFTSTDILGKTTVARWVRRTVTGPKIRGRQDSNGEASPLPTPPLPEYKWTFSIVNPETRRHPIMGVIFGHELEIYDTYNTLSTSSGRFPPTKPFGLATSGSEPTSPISIGSPDERLTELVPERYKKLMMATASWLSLRSEGWPASLNPKMRRVMPSVRTACGNSDGERRKTFHFGDKSQVPSGAIAAPVQNGVPKEATREPKEGGIPKRSLSTGAAFMRSRGVMLETSDHKYSSEQEKRPTQKSYKPRPSHHPDAGEEKTHTCRIKVLKMTKRLFHRKEYQTE